MNTNLLVRKTVLNRFKAHIRSVKAQKKSHNTDLSFTAYMSCIAFIEGLELLNLSTCGTFKVTEFNRMRRIVMYVYYRREQ